MRRKLLLADDSVTIQRVVELTFSGGDIDVVTVSDGDQAIARLIADPPDVVLADIAMPRKNGYKVAAFVKEHPTLSKVPVLLLAGAFEPVDDDRARRVGCDGVLVKPFETHDLVARVRELIEGRGRAEAGVPEAAAAPPPPPAPAPPMPAQPTPVQPTPAQPAPAQPREPRTSQAPAAPPESLDPYFDRLDVAFGGRAQNPPRPFPHLATPGEDREAAPARGGRTSVVADLFHAFLDVELGVRAPGSVAVPESFERIRRGNTIE